MNAVVGQWRATYTPGDWVLLSGPTSLVLLEPPAPERSSMINMLWEEVVASSSMSDLAGRLATFPIDSLPSFAAFFWTGDGMRSLVRGSVSVVDLSSGVTVAQGEGIQTWTEVGLHQVSQVLVETQASDGTPLELPLVVGAARASSVRLDASEAARVSSPQRAVEANPTPAYAVPVEVDPAYPEPADVDSAGREPVDAEQRGGVPETEPARAALPDADPVPDADGGAVTEGPSTEPMDDPFADESELEPEPSPTVPTPPRGLEDAALTDLENADTQLMPPAFALSAQEPPAPEVPLAGPGPGVSDNSLIMAVVCQYGHPSPQNATTCRTCGSPIAPQGPQLVPRPVLAVLRSSDGTTVEVDRAVLIGRAPSGQRSTARAPRLMTVPSPGHDISRTHLEVLPEGWQIVITDLHSTNGTVLVRPGGVDRQQLAPGDAVPAQLGSVVELGDGISVLIDYPQ